MRRWISQTLVTITAVTAMMGISVANAQTVRADERANVRRTTPGTSVEARSEAPSPHAVAIVELINQLRSEVGAPRLRWDPACSAAAAEHAADAARNRIRGHQGSDGSTLEERYLRYGGVPLLLAENQIVLRDPSGNSLTPRSIVQSWRRSADHWANMIDPELTHSGVGIFRAGDELIAVQCFSALAGQPRLSSPRASPNPVRPRDNQSDYQTDNPTDQMAREVSDLINQYRIRTGLAPLEWDPACARAAKVHAEDTGRHRIQGHTGSDGSGLADRYRRFSSRYSRLGENWAYLQDSSGRTLTAQNLVSAWHGSRGHWANAMSPSFTHGGVGVYQQGGELVAVHCFSTP